jgi:Peptidase A4 family
VQPAVTCGAAGTFSSFWVGLDGDGTPTVEQTGTEADCANGAATYQGWYEIFPNAPVFYRNPVQPGDQMSASVVADGNGVFTLTLADGTQGWTQTTQQVEAAAQLGSAEVIAEAPSAGTVLPLADFGAVNFTGATVNGAALGGSANLNELTLESGAGAPLATPSGLTGGNAFSVTFDRAGQ